MSAVISDCGRYRYMLEREWMTGSGTCLFVMLNPSTADAEQDDPTIRRCVGFAQSWGYQRLTVANVFALRSPHPKVLLEADDPVGDDNDHWTEKLYREADLAVAAWGAFWFARDRAADLAASYDLHCLAVTKEGCPQHPLYIKADTKPIPFPATPEHLGGESGG